MYQSYGRLPIANACFSAKKVESAETQWAARAIFSFWLILWGFTKKAVSPESVGALAKYFHIKFGGGRQNYWCNKISQKLIFIFITFLKFWFWVFWKTIWLPLSFLRFHTHKWTPLILLYILDPSPHRKCEIFWNKNFKSKSKNCRCQAKKFLGGSTSNSGLAKL